MADEWTPPTEASSTDYRTPQQGFGALLSRITRLAARMAALEGASPLRQAGVKGRPGMLSSIDFDGDGGHVNLGTKGWMLGASDGGDSFFILNGRLVIEELDAQAAALAAQDVIIAGQVTDLAAANATLTTAVANIATLVGQQTWGDVGNNAASGVTLGTGQTSYAVVSFTVPAGFTQAHVMGVSAMYSGGTVAAIVRTQIAGVNGIDMYAFTNAAYASATATLARKFAVTPGQVFTVASVANTGAGTTSAYLATSATVTYYR